MKVSGNWKDYELLDCSEGERLERWGEIVLIRPDPQVIWKTAKKHPLWNKAHARYNRSSSGGGGWTVYRELPETWKIRYGELVFNIKTMGFKHTGVFPEQAVNWDFTMDMIRSAGRPVSVLNLFAYTGAATAACLKAGAAVVHVDASKGMVAWAKENALACGVSGEKVRWIVDDCLKFVGREIRRCSRYDAVIMDPPSYGRGPGGETWKLEEEIFGLAGLCAKLLSADPLLFMINSYTTGLSPSVMEYILGSCLPPNRGGITESYELGLPVTSTGMALPCGATSVWRSKR